MNESNDRLLVDWLANGPDRGPSHGLDRALAATRQTTQRPGWTILERWLPTPVTFWPAIAPRPYLFVVVGALMLVALAGALFLIGSQRHPAPPFGLAANGSIVVGVDGHLWLADPDGTNARRLFIGQTFASSPVFSPDGTRLAFKTRGAVRTPWSIWVADADGSNARLVTGEFPIVAVRARWHRVGAGQLRDRCSARAIGGSTGCTASISAVDLLRPLSDGGGDRSYPALSPDGQWLAYQKRSASGPAKVSLMVSHPDGIGRTRASASSLAATPRTRPRNGRPVRTGSPTSDRMAGGMSVAFVDLEGIETVVSLAGEDAVNPAWSPDARHLAYAIADRSVVVDVADPSDADRHPSGTRRLRRAWAPDATALLGIDGPCSGLYVIPVDDPGAARPIDMPEGEIDIFAWQRTAP